MGKRKTSKEKLNDFIKKHDLKVTSKCYNNLLKLFEYCDNSPNFNAGSAKRNVPKMVEYGIDDLFVQRCRRSLRIGAKLTLLKCLYMYSRNGYNKWDEYRKIQSQTNTFEYKQAKYNMTKEEFDEYNKSRSCTLENFIKRHGHKEGTKKWNEYCKKQSYVGVSLDYFIEKNCGDYELGKSEWKHINRLKSHTVESIMEREGISESDAIIKVGQFHDHMSSRSSLSKGSQELFWVVYDNLSETQKKECYFGELNKEFGKYDHKRRKYLKYDFTLSNSKIIIEYNGDYFHANPKYYKPDDKNFFFMREASAKDIWKSDHLKHALVENLGFRVIIVWESNYLEDKELTIRRVLDEINRAQ